MATFGNDKTTTPADVLRREAEAARELEESLAESRDRVAKRCPECGSIGSLEEVDGVLRCVDCDETVAATAKLSGFGRR
jgi:ribosomal protein L37AE/L43A